MPDWLTFALQLTVVGVLIVFGALTLIALVVSLLKKLDNRWQKRERDQEEARLASAPTIDNLTLVLISAAAASMLQGRFHIRKVRRLLPRDATSGPWSLEGRAILHGSHVVSRKR